MGAEYRNNLAALSGLIAAVVGAVAGIIALALRSYGWAGLGACLVVAGALCFKGLHYKL